MKKNILLLMVMLLSTVTANAVNWQFIPNDNNMNLMIDEDSVRYINNNETYYAIRFKVLDNPEKVAYIKSNSETGYIGIIETGDYTEKSYKPHSVFYNAHVFMKPLKEDSFLTYANDYVSSLLIDSNIAENINDEENIKPVSYKGLDTQAFLAQVRSKLWQNWNPPKNNVNATIMVTLGTDGSLQNYKFTKESGDEETDRSIISAIEQTVPYIKFPHSVKNSSAANFQFTFDKKLFKKSVY